MRSTCRFADYIVAACLASILLIIACGGAARRTGDAERFPEYPDGRGDVPLDLDEDYFRVPEKVPEEAGGRVTQRGIDWQTIDSLRRAGEGIDSVSTIYRVQLYASQYYSEASYEKEIAADVFEEPLYLKYEVPYYKILLGNETKQEAGRRLLSTARSLGYDNAWLVQSPPDSIYYDFIMPDSLKVTADSLSADSIAVDTTSAEYEEQDQP